MLRFLRIRKLAVIEAVDLEFDPGFNALTGETGAGKSILVEAVGLLLGARASADLVRTGEAQATIEAAFEDRTASELVIRREITSQGRSRSFVNGALATAQQLRDLSAGLVELHGQHEHQALLDAGTHLRLLDEYARVEDFTAEVGSAWTDVRALREQLERARMDGREREARLDLIAFQLAEIQKAAPGPSEDESLQTTRQVLASAERLRQLCEDSYAALYESDHAVLSRLGGVWKRVTDLAAIDPQFAPHLEVRDEIKAHLEDLAFSLRQYAAGIDASPGRLQEVEDRLALLERLKRKYGPTLFQVIQRGEVLAREQELLTLGAERAGQIEQELSRATERYLVAARGLSRRRRAGASRFGAEIEAVLGELAMERARLEMRVTECEAAPEMWSEHGIDQAELFVSPNPGEEMRPLARVASGGELSRIMLALRSRAAGETGVRTLIFDEVDAGIGGRVADAVGTKLRALGERFQVLCITHLPQIAARATTHFRIDKTIGADRTRTCVERLDRAGRVEEIARMIGGTAVSDQVRATAQELLGAPSGKASRGAKGKERTKGESETSRSVRPPL
jgi:DNA repair protein RecN (Recombination protein N)